MPSPTLEDIKALDPVIIGLHDASTLDELEDFVLNRLPAAFGASFASWNEHDPTFHMRRVVTSSSHKQLVDPLVEDLNETLPTHPLYPSFFDFSSGKVIKRNSVERTRENVSRRDYHGLPFYRRVGSPLKIEDQLVMHVHAEERKGILLTFHGENEFSPKEHLTAVIMRGHIIARLHSLQAEGKRFLGDSLRIRKELNKILSKRETEVLRLVCKGLGNREIALELGISKRTSDTHVSNVLNRLDVSNRFELISRFAHRISNY